MSAPRRQVLPTSSTSAPHAVVRMCVGCRRRDEQSVLLRVVGAEASAGTTRSWAVLPDPRRRGPGRGAYLHPHQECLGLAITRRTFTRALRQSGPPDTGVLETWVEQHTHSSPGTVGR